MKAALAIPGLLISRLGADRDAFVMPGLVPGIHDFASMLQAVDGRDKLGHDQSKVRNYSEANSRNRLRNRVSTVLAGQGVR